MSHREIHALLAEYAQGRLETASATEIAAHLAGCPDCREWLATYGLLERALAEGAGRHPASAELAAWAAAGDDPPAAAAAHLQACAGCARELRLVSQAIAAARGPEQAEEDLAERPRRSRIVWAAAAVALLVLGGSQLLELRRAPESEYVISGVRLASEETITARSIHASAAEIAAGGNVVFAGADRIALGEGFVVAAGARFEAGNTMPDADRSLPQ